MPRPAQGKPVYFIALLLCLCVCFPGAQAADNTRWIATWTADPQPVWDKSFGVSTRIPAALSDRTIRQISRISLGGKRVRIVISNTYGNEPLIIGEAHVGLSAGSGQVISGSNRKLTFGGAGSITIPPGAPALSDPIDLSVAPLSSLAVSVYFPDNTPLTTFHWDGLQTAYIAAGNVGGRDEINALSTMRARVLVSGVLVEAPEEAYTVAALGDSITDGNATTKDANRRWPDVLAQRLVKNQVAVINAGISGARVLKDRMGVNALARFEHDVLGQPGTKAVIVHIGINDIGWPGATEPNSPATSAEEIIAGYRQLIARAKVRNIRILGGTLLPFEGTRNGYYTQEKERVRQAVNQWIRTSGEFDAVVDFDTITRDPVHPARLLPAYDSGDHLHPNDAGNQAMAEGIDIKALLIKTGEALNK